MDSYWNPLVGRGRVGRGRMQKFVLQPIPPSLERVLPPVMQEARGPAQQLPKHFRGLTVERREHLVRQKA
jgi:hypothetical protein